MPWLPLGSLLTSISIAGLCTEVDYLENMNDNLLRNGTLKRTKPKIKKMNEVPLVNLALV